MYCKICLVAHMVQDELINKAQEIHQKQLNYAAGRLCGSYGLLS